MPAMTQLAAIGATKLMTLTSLEQSAKQPARTAAPGHQQKSASSQPIPKCGPRDSRDASDRPQKTGHKARWCRRAAVAAHAMVSVTSTLPRVALE